MRIGIIGAGNIGGALTRRLSELGHEVAVANSRAPETLAELAAETGARALPVAEVARGAELVVVSVPLRAVSQFPAGLLAGVAPGAPVVDTCNYYPARDGVIPEIEAGLSESRYVSRLLGVPVVKAFNTIGSRHLGELGRPAGAPGRIGLPVAGDEPEAKALVMALVEELGFDAVDAGSIDESWRQQPGAPVYGADLDAEGTRAALARALPARPQRAGG